MYISISYIYWFTYQYVFIYVYICIYMHDSMQVMVYIQMIVNMQMTHNIIDCNHSYLAYIPCMLFLVRRYWEMLWPPSARLLSLHRILWTSRAVWICMGNGAFKNSDCSSIMHMLCMIYICIYMSYTMCVFSDYKHIIVSFMHVLYISLCFEYLYICMKMWIYIYILMYMWMYLYVQYRAYHTRRYMICVILLRDMDLVYILVHAYIYIHILLLWFVFISVALPMNCGHARCLLSCTVLWNAQSPIIAFEKKQETKMCCKLNRPLSSHGEPRTKIGTLNRVPPTFVVSLRLAFLR